MCQRLHIRQATIGQSLVETALVLPILFLFVFGMLDLGRAVYDHVTLSFAVREGGRVAIVSSRPETEIRQAVIDAAPGLNLSPGNITITGTRQPGSLVTVGASYTFRLITPLISQIVGSSLLIQAQTSMIVE